MIPLSTNRKTFVLEKNF